MAELEVCIDNIESLPLAIEGGATRIELCSSLALGGLTPSLGFMKQARKITDAPIHVMIRPRQGDFLYSSQDINIMLEDIALTKKIGLDGIVFGILTPQGHIDKINSQMLMDAAQGLQVTFHRAIDQVTDPIQALEDVIQLGCHRILTSGRAVSAAQGVEQIRAWVLQANQRIKIMAGAGINIENALKILTDTKADALHLSGKTTRSSQMQTYLNQAKMGDKAADDFLIPMTDKHKIQAIKQAINSNSK